MHHTHPSTNVNVMTDLLFGDTTLSVILSLSWTTAIATRNTNMPLSKFSSQPKETKKFHTFVIYFLVVRNREKQ